MTGQEILQTSLNLSGGTSVVICSDKEKYVYSGYGIKFDSAGS